MGSVSPQISNLTVCAGLGVILGAFGTYASASARSWSIAGAGAVTIILYIILHSTREDVGSSDFKDIYTRGFIRFTGEKEVVQFVRVSDDLEFYGKMNFTGNVTTYEFLIDRPKLITGSLTVEFGQNSMFIPSEFVNEQLKSGDPLDFRFDSGEYDRIIDNEGTVISTVTHIGRVDHENINLEGPLR